MSADLTGELRLALMDAAKNCETEDATVVLSLRGGAQLEGTLEKNALLSQGGVVLHLPGGGWVTIRRDAIDAVESRPEVPF